MKRFKGPQIKRIQKNKDNLDIYDINNRTLYTNYHNKTITITDYNKDNYSENSNSVRSSYKYRKINKGKNTNTISSRDSYFNNSKNFNNDNYSSVSMSENGNLICPDCINDALTFVLY